VTSPDDQAHTSGAEPDGDPTESPDLAFALGAKAAAVADPPSEPAPGPEEQARRLVHRIARDLAAIAPKGWRRMDASFALTVVTDAAHVVFGDDQERILRVQPPRSAVDLVREHRQLSAQLGDGPWWRMVLTLADSGEIEVIFDYGDEPFPDDQLFAAQAYAADLRAFPRRRLPVWLAAYVGHDGRQSRTPQRAAAQARADREAGTTGVMSENEFPEFPAMWARWAVVAAAFVAVGSDVGPRILPALGYFEGAKRSGSTLYALPGGRAVLSGGVWNAPELDAAYNDGAALPRLYEGAPAWVANPVLNPRAAGGLLSFCYWWEGGAWYRGESPTADRLAPAVPGVWTADTVTDIVVGLLNPQDPDERRAAVATLVSAAEVGVVTRDTLADVFGDADVFDVDGAFYQLTLAGVALVLPEPMAEAEAVDRVRRYLLEREYDTSRFPPDQLRAHRISVGWMVTVPTAPGDIAVGRALFYVADDGVLEQSSSSSAT
jgi:hypothetical protein